MLAGGSAALPIAPTTPAPVATVGPPSPPKNTPSKITRFLKYAQDNLGIEAAYTYEGMLTRNGYGPDVLSGADVSIKDLESCGFTPGDAIRLKRGAADWWNGPEAKRPKTSDRTEDVEPTEHATTYDIRFEKRFHGGGSSTCFGSGLSEAMGKHRWDYDWWYYNPITQCLERVPTGFVPNLDPACRNPNVLDDIESDEEGDGVTTAAGVVEEA